MICECCRNNIDKGKTVCDICGMPLLAGKGFSSDVKESVINDIKRKYLDGISLSIRVYRYEVTDNDISEASTDLMHLAYAKQLDFDNLFVCSQEFEDLKSKRDFSVDLEINGNGSSSLVKLDFKPEKPISHKTLGLKLMPGFNCQILVGDGEEYIASDLFSLLEKQ